MIIRELFTKLGWKVDDAAIDRYERRIQSVGRTMEQAGRNAVLKLSLPVGAAMTGMLMAASNATEVRNKFMQVFRGMDKDMEQWAVTFADTVGRSENKVREMLGAFQSQLVGLGFDPAQAAQMSRTLQAYAIDFGSFNNISDQESFERFISAMSGSGEVLDRFGINIKENALNLELQALGLAKSTAKATEQQKATARLSLIMKAMQRQGAVGDAVRTLEDFANKLRQTTSLIEKMAVGFGRLLIPYATAFLNIVNRVMQAVNKWSDETRGVVLVIGALAVTLPFATLGLGILIKTLFMVRGAFAAAAVAARGFSLSALAMPAAVIAGLLAVILLIQDFIVWTKGENKSVFGTLFGDYDDSFFRYLSEDLTKGFRGLFDIIQGILSPNPDEVREAWRKAGRGMADGLLDGLKGLGGLVADGLGLDKPGQPGSNPESQKRKQLPWWLRVSANPVEWAVQGTNALNRLTTAVSPHIQEMRNFQPSITVQNNINGVVSEAMIPEIEAASRRAATQALKEQMIQARSSLAGTR